MSNDKQRDRELDETNGQGADRQGGTGGQGQNGPGQDGPPEQTDDELWEEVENEVPSEEEFERVLEELFIAFVTQPQLGGLDVVVEKVKYALKLWLFNYHEFKELHQKRREGLFRVKKYPHTGPPGKQKR